MAHRRRFRGKSSQFLKKQFEDEDDFAVYSGPKSRKEAVEGDRDFSGYKGTGTEHKLESLNLTAAQIQKREKAEQYEKTMKIAEYKKTLKFNPVDAEPGEYTIRPGFFHFVRPTGHVESIAATGKDGQGILMPPTPRKEESRAARRGKSEHQLKGSFARNPNPFPDVVTTRDVPDGIDSRHGHWVVVFDTGATPADLSDWPKSRYTNLPKPSTVPRTYRDKHGDWFVEYMWAKSNVQRNKLVYALMGNPDDEYDPMDNWAITPADYLVYHNAHLGGVAITANQNHDINDEYDPTDNWAITPANYVVHYNAHPGGAVMAANHNHDMHAEHGNGKTQRAVRKNQRRARTEAVAASVSDGVAQIAGNADARRFARPCRYPNCSKPNCPYEHEVVPLAKVPEGPTVGEKAVTPVCRDFQKSKCKFGDRCKFEHVKIEPPQPPPPEPSPAPVEAATSPEVEATKPKLSEIDSLAHFTELVRQHYFTMGTEEKSYVACKGKILWFRQSCKPPLTTWQTLEKCRQIVVDERARFVDIETLEQKASVIRNRVADQLRNWVSTPLAFIPPQMDAVTFSEFKSITDGTVGPDQIYEPVSRPNVWKPTHEYKSVANQFSFGMTMFADHIWMPRTQCSYNAEDGMRKRQLLTPISNPDTRRLSYRAGLDALTADWSGVNVPDATLEEKRDTFLKKYPETRRKCILAWKHSLDVGGYRDDRAIADVKREWLFRKPAGKNNPRIISTHHESQLLFMGPEVYHEFKHRKNALFGGDNWVERKHILVGGMDAVKQGEIVSFNEMRGYFPHESDGSRWDGRTESEGLDTEVELWKQVGMPEEHADMLALNIDTKGRCRAGGSYKTRGKRDSGTINTSDGNGAEGHLIDGGFLSVLPADNPQAWDEYEDCDNPDDLSEVELPESWTIDDEPVQLDPMDYQVARNGDDMMTFTARPLSKLEKKKWERHYTNCGHKAPIVSRTYDTLEFNGGTFPRVGSGRRVWAPYIGKMCAKLFMPRQRNLTEMEIEDHIYGVAAGMRHYTFLPVLGPVLAAILTKGRTAKTIARDEYKCNLNDAIEVDKNEVYDYYSARYGIDIGTYDFLRALPFHLPYRAWNIPGLEVVGRIDGVIHDEPAELGVEFEMLNSGKGLLQSWRNAITPTATLLSVAASDMVKKLLPEGPVADIVKDAVAGFVSIPEVASVLDGSAFETQPPSERDEESADEDDFAQDDDPGQDARVSVQGIYAQGAETVRRRVRATSEAVRTAAAEAATDAEERAGEVRRKAGRHTSRIKQGVLLAAKTTSEAVRSRASEARDTAGRGASKLRKGAANAAATAAEVARATSEEAQRVAQSQADRPWRQYWRDAKSKAHQWAEHRLGVSMWPTILASFFFFTVPQSTESVASTIYFIFYDLNIIRRNLFAKAKARFFGPPKADVSWLGRMRQKARARWRRNRRRNTKRDSGDSDSDEDFGEFTPASESALGSEHVRRKNKFKRAAIGVALRLAAVPAFRSPMAWVAERL